MNKFQRIGSVSNTHVGNDFECIARATLTQHGLNVTPKMRLLIGVGDKKKEHAFDLGTASQKVIVECKSHKWTSGGNIPSAKMTVWNEAMYYFAIAPTEYRKILFVLKDFNAKKEITLAEYYIKTYEHFIPEGVEIWEYDQDSKQVFVINKTDKTINQLVTSY